MRIIGLAMLATGITVNYIIVGEGLTAAASLHVNSFAKSVRHWANQNTSSSPSKNSHSNIDNGKKQQIEILNRELVKAVARTGK